MEKIKRCTRCIIPSSLPSVSLDEHGVCNQCNKYEALYGNWDSQKSDKKEEFDKILSKAKKMKRPYDCLITLSGGKDSTYSLYLCSKVYGLNCLCVTFDNGFLSEHAQSNIFNAIKSTNADHIFYRVNRKTMINLYRMFLIKTGTLCSPCMKGIEVAALRTALAFKVPVVIHGISDRRGYEKYPELVAAGEIFSEVVKGEKIAGNMDQFRSIERRKAINALFRYFFRSSLLVPRNIGIYKYIDVTRNEIYNVIKKEMSWKAPEGEAEHMDCLIHGIVTYIRTLKFPELTDKTTFLSGLVRFGELTRDEAIVQETKEYSNSNRPAKLDSFLEELGITNSQFNSYTQDWKAVQKYRNNKKEKLISIYHKLTRG